MRLRKLLAFLAGFITGSFPPEAIVILMEPPPGRGRLPPDVAVAARRARWSRTSRRIRHLHPVRRKVTPLSRDRTPPTPPG